MKKYYKLLAAFCFWLFCFLTAFPQSIRIITFNIPIDLASESANAWNNRKVNLVNIITFHKAYLIGLQESQKHQIEYIQQSLAEYSWFGVSQYVRHDWILPDSFDGFFPSNHYPDLAEIIFQITILTAQIMWRILASQQDTTNVLLWYLTQ